MHTLAENRKIYHDFEILETLIAGVVLDGPEVKSAKLGQVSLRGAFVLPRGNELFLENVSISAYAPAKREQKTYQPIHPRKLLLNRKEIGKLIGMIQTKGQSVVPLKFLNIKGFVKVELALVRGKKTHDKRESIKQRELDRSTRRMLRIKQ